MSQKFISPTFFLTFLFGEKLSFLAKLVYSIEAWDEPNFVCLFPPFRACLPPDWKFSLCKRRGRTEICKLFLRLDSPSPPPPFPPPEAAAMPNRRQGGADGMQKCLRDSTEQEGGKRNIGCRPPHAGSADIKSLETEVETSLLD